MGEAHAEVARAVLCHAQRQPLRLRLLPSLLARQRWRRCSPLRRRRRHRPPLRRSRGAQRRLLSGGKAAQVHRGAIAAHLRQVGFGSSGLVVHAEVARAVLGQAQREPLRLRLLPSLLARQRHRRGCSPLRRRLPLWRPRDAQRRLLGGGEEGHTLAIASQAYHLATAPHLRPVGVDLALRFVAHAKVSRLVLAHEQLVWAQLSQTGRVLRKTSSLNRLHCTWEVGSALPLTHGLGPLALGGCFLRLANRLTVSRP
eukprot:scaffold18623_cov64-Phaeocystis_antarctica.AAC.1